jgi:hypothetical protein
MAVEDRGVDGDVEEGDSQLLRAGAFLLFSPPPVRRGRARVGVPTFNVEC